MVKDSPLFPTKENAPDGRYKHFMKVLIVGQGYAGSMLAWFLLNNGVDVTVADRNDQDGSTRVSAGIMLPVTGRRLAKTEC
jgi:flavin-dependent dehydrogenase